MVSISWLSFFWSATQAFIESEIEKQKEIADSLPDDHNKDWSALDRLFLEMLGD